VEVEAEICGRPVRIKTWEYAIVSPRGGTAPVLFLDTALCANPEEDRNITTHLYGGDERYRPEQERAREVGGMMVLQA
jgi:starch phosphorylase